MTFLIYFLFLFWTLFIFWFWAPKCGEFIPSKLFSSFSLFSKRWGSLMNDFLKKKCEFLGFPFPSSLLPSPNSVISSNLCFLHCLFSFSFSFTPSNTHKRYCAYCIHFLLTPHHNPPTFFLHFFFLSVATTYYYLGFFFRIDCKWMTSHNI